jgi:hypothetical protein
MCQTGIPIETAGFFDSIGQKRKFSPGAHVVRFTRKADIRVRSSKVRLVPPCDIIDGPIPRGRGAYPRAARTLSLPRRHAQIREIPLRSHANPQADATGHLRALGVGEREFILVGELGKQQRIVGRRIVKNRA